MDFIKSIFWNSEQKRIRSGYRVFLQLVIFLIIIIGLEILFTSIDSSVKYNSFAPIWFILAIAFMRIASGGGSVWVAGRYLDRRKFKDFGFHFNKNWWFDFIFGLILGAVLLSLIFIIEYLLGWVKITDLFYTNRENTLFIIPFALFILIFITVGVSEELVSRSYMTKNVAEGLKSKRINPKWAIIIALIFSSVIFGMGHFGNPNASIVSSLNIMVAGLFLGLGYVITGELAIPIGIHITWNFFQGNIFGFPVSGTTIPRDVATIFKIEQGGPDFWTGGSFGPEAGMLGFLMMMLGIVLTLGWIRFRRGKSAVTIYEPLANPPEKLNI